MKLKDYQNEAVENLKNGSILCGGVGSGKSITALAYYMFKVCLGSVKIEDDPVHDKYWPMLFPRDLYVITTAKKRDSLEWNKECSNWLLNNDFENSHSHVKVTIDSWNNIKKYKDVYGAFFIFDEQRVVGSGSWVKIFLSIAQKNQWILLSATPGDTWSDYIPVFVANGFYKNKTDFNNQHCIFARFSKYPKIERYINQRKLERYRDEVLVPMKDDRETIRHEIPILVDYDKEKYRTVFRDRWDPYENCPIEETGKWVYLLRRVVNENESRLEELSKILDEKRCLIVFYNYTYEMEMIKEWLDKTVTCREWNGNKHEDVPIGKSWVYLVQYTAGCEGWNCVTTDTIVFFSQSYSYRQTEQAMGRIDRINTPFKDLYYYKLRSNAPIDMMIYRALKNKKNFNMNSLKKVW